MNKIGSPPLNERRAPKLDQEYTVKFPLSKNAFKVKVGDIARILNNDGWDSVVVPFYTESGGGNPTRKDWTLNFSGGKKGDLFGHLKLMSNVPPVMYNVKCHVLNKHDVIILSATGICGAAKPNELTKGWSIFRMDDKILPGISDFMFDDSIKLYLEIDVFDKSIEETGLM